MPCGTGRVFGIFKDIKNLVIGMKITSRHLGRRAITIQYPEERWEMPERSRGIVVLLSDKETGELNCTSCMLCMRACPTGAIIIDAPRDENKKRQLKKFDIDFGLCCFCGLCEEACNFSALKMASMYEYSTENKEDLTWDMNKLQAEGLDVPYVDTRKKKKPKPVVKPVVKEAVVDSEPKPAPASNPTDIKQDSGESNATEPPATGGGEQSPIDRAPEGEKEQ